MKNSLRRIFALLMAVMMIAALGMSAFAADAPAAIGSINFNKTVQKDTNAYAPSATYSFEIKGYTPEADVTPDGTQAKPFVGPEGGATVADITSAPDNVVNPDVDGDVKDIGETSRVYTGTITFDHTKFTDPGVYRYEVTEENGSYAGMTYDNTTKYLDVYVAEADDGSKIVFSAVMYDKDTGATEAAKAAGFTNTLATTTLTINKKVDGNLGDTTKEFEFSVTVTGAEGELFYAVKNNNTEAPILIQSGVAATVLMKHSDTLVVYGLSAGDTYSVTEEAGEYVATITKGNEEVDEAASEDTGIGAEAVEYTFTNTKSADVPTGIAMTVLPFVAMIALAAIVAILFFQKRERREA